jgi:hypothetical protein
VAGTGERLSGNPVPTDAEVTALDPEMDALRWPSDRGWLDASAAQFLDLNEFLAETYEDVARAGEQRNGG